MNNSINNEEFCLLENIQNDNNSMLLSTNLTVDNKEFGEKENINIINIINMIKKQHSISLIIPGLPLIYGHIKLTNYRLLFIPFETEFRKYKFYRNYFEIPLGSIHDIIPNSIDKNNKYISKILDLNQQLLSFNNINEFKYKYILEITTKDGRKIMLLFTNISKNNFYQLVNELKENSFTNDIKQCFAIKARINNNYFNNMNNGWNIYNFFEEFTRQKVNLNKWRISSINLKYKYCETYPSYFLIPVSITDIELQEIKDIKFRSKTRIPVLTYYHCDTDSVIMRSSQPMTGMGGLGGFVSTSWWKQNTCKADEKLLKYSNIKCILDARPKMNAVVNQAAGGGYENVVDIYKGIRLIFGNIQNIHEVRRSYNIIIKTVQSSINKHNYSSLFIPHIKYLYIEHKYKNKYNNNDEYKEYKEINKSLSTGQLMKMDNNNTTIKTKNGLNTSNKSHTPPLHDDTQICPENIQQINLPKETQDYDYDDLYDSMLRDDNFWSNIQSSLWFTYLRNIIVSSIIIVSMIDAERKSVLVHCSDGWDRTAQLCSLAQILLDPYFRTIKGFCTLIEKDWISFGHKYQERFGHTRDDIKNDQRSPIFIQFLDCVHQIVNQFPYQFEYTIDFLSYIAYHTTSCLYGTFLTNSEYERNKKYKFNQKTQSIWSILLDEQFVIHHKLKNINYNPSNNVLYLDHRSINITLWNYYTKIDPFPIRNIQNNNNNNNNVFTPNNLDQTDIISTQKDLEIKQLKNKINKLEKIKIQYQQIMQCIDTKNGFLLKNITPIIPDLDYVSQNNSDDT